MYEAAMLGESKGGEVRAVSYRMSQHEWLHSCLLLLKVRCLGIYDLGSVLISDLSALQYIIHIKFGCFRSDHAKQFCLENRYKN